MRQVVQRLRSLTEELVEDIPLTKRRRNIMSNFTRVLVGLMTEHIEAGYISKLEMVVSLLAAAAVIAVKEVQVETPTK